MAMSRVQINGKSEAKRGFKAKTYKLHESDITRIEQLANRLGLSQGKTIMAAITLLERQSPSEIKSIDPPATFSQGK